MRSSSAKRSCAPRIPARRWRRCLRIRGEIRNIPAASTGSEFVSAIVAEGISKHWTTADGEVRAVDGLSFAFERGTLSVLLGPSGCGKSTTLRLIAGLEIADAGRI